MKKHPDSFKLTSNSVAAQRLEQFKLQATSSGECTLFSGTVRELCPMAPNNVNTMATAAMAADCLGFDRCRAVLVADYRLQAHVVEVLAQGPSEGRREEEVFRVHTVRYNPAATGAVTGNATYASFLSSLLRVASLAADNHTLHGIQFC
jgi:predicted dinucleotide-utilizing enzyme